MTTVLLTIHIFVTLALIGVVLIQRSEGGGLGIGNSQGMGSFMGGRGTANLLTRTTAVLASIFFVLCLTLALLNRGTAGAGHSVFDAPPPAAPAAAPAAPPAQPAPPPNAPAGETKSPAPAAETPAATTPPAAEGPTAAPAPAPAAPATPKPPSAPVD